MNFKHIHIGEMIEKIVAESGIEISRLCNFMKFTEEEITKTYNEENLPTDVLLKWSKILEYDFFRIYTQHLILYAPPSAETKTGKKPTKKSLFLSSEKTFIPKKSSILF